MIAPLLSSRCAKCRHATPWGCERPHYHRFPGDGICDLREADSCVSVTSLAELDLNDLPPHQPEGEWQPLVPASPAEPASETCGNCTTGLPVECDGRPCSSGDPETERLDHPSPAESGALSEERIMEIERLASNGRPSERVGAALHELLVEIHRLRSSPGARDERSEVVAFAQAMEKKLREHDDDWGSRGWGDASPSRLMDRLREETDKLVRVILGRPNGIDQWRAEVRKRAANVGNFAMMLADLCGALPIPSPTGKGGA